MSDQQTFFVEPDARRRLRRWPHVPSTRQLAILVCAHGPGSGRVSINRDGDVQIDFDGQFFRGQSVIERKPRQFVLYWNHIELSVQLRRQGIATDLFVRLVKLATSWGFRQIRAIGAGNAQSEAVGYYVLPKLGFDGKIPKPERLQLPHCFRGIQTIRELYALPGGEDAWKTYGREIAVNFDLSPDRMSRKALWHYLHKKGKLPPEFSSGDPSLGIDLDLSERDEEALRQAWEEMRRQKKRRSAS